VCLGGMMPTFLVGTPPSWIAVALSDYVLACVPVVCQSPNKSRMRQHKKKWLSPANQTKPKSSPLWRTRLQGLFGTENPRVGGSTPSLATTSRTVAPQD